MSSVSRSSKEYLLQLLKQKKKLRGLRDLWYFDKHILGYKDMTAQDRFHGEMCNFVEDPLHEKVLVLEPRGSLKTSVITIGYSVQQVTKNGNIRILIASEEFNTAQKMLAEIKGHFESNEVYKDLYGKLRGDGKWSEKEIIVATRTKWFKEPTITCAGIDVTKVGLHYDLIIIDDPHSDKNVTSREQIDKVISWYKLVLSLLDPGGKLIIIGTRWHYDELFGWMIAQERLRDELGKSKRYFILEKEACDDDLENEDVEEPWLLWPERLTREFLINTKLDQGPYIFSCQYRNRPVDDDSAMFKKSWLRFHDPNNLPENLATFTTVDPIRDEEGKDFVGIVTCSIGRDFVAHVREVRRGKWDDSDVLDQLEDVYKLWKPRKIGIETVAWQKLYFKYMKQEQLRRGIKLPIMELSTDTSKTKKMRIRSMIPYFKAGLFSFPGTSLELLRGNIAVTVDELLRYPRVATDDCIDALAYMEQLLQRPQIHAIIKRVPRGSFYGIKERHSKPKREVLGTYNA